MMFCKERDWVGLYKRDYDLATPESMAHPAKAAWGLAFRIVEHLIELGLLRDGDTILDPMAGTGRFCIAALMKGFPAIGVELEEKFCRMMRDNKTYVEAKTYRKLDWEILQGDARELSRLLTERGLIGLTSPPYSDTSDRASVQNEFLKQAEAKHGRRYTKASFKDEGYSSDPANIGNLPDKVIGITSPPYANPRKTSQEYDDLYDLRRPPGVAWGRESFRGRYSENPNNIGHLPDRLVGITSPPYEGSEHLDRAERWTKDGYWSQTQQSARYTKGGNAGDSEGQIGQEQGQTYLSAMACVYSECQKVCSVLVVIIKDPTRGGKIRRLGRDTCKLLRQSGFQIFDYHKSILFTQHEQADLFGKSQKKVKGRLSFFKRLSWQKGSPVSNFEHIIFARNLHDAPLVGISSPPYSDQSKATDLDSRLRQLAESSTTGVGKQAAQDKATWHYSANPANIGNLSDR